MSDQPYSKNTTIDSAVKEAIGAITQGMAYNGLTKRIKIAPTGILLASEDHEQLRFHPGSDLITYTGMTAEGAPIRETYNGGIANITLESVILNNPDPVRYAKDHPQQGQVVRGSYNAAQEFVPNANHDTVLFNEYVSDKAWVKENYGIDASMERQYALKLVPSFFLPVAAEWAGETILTSKGGEIKLMDAGHIIIDTRTKEGKVQVTSVHAIAPEYDNTYRMYDEYLASLK